MSAIVLYLTMALMVWKSSAVPNHPTGCGILNVGGLNDIVVRPVGRPKIPLADFGEFPWTVALLHKHDRSYFGAGSLIHPRVVLTAASTLRGKSLYSFVVRAGIRDLQTHYYEERIPSWMTYHSNFESKRNNFALIKLREDFPMDDFIRTVCLPPANFAPASGQKCLFGGWGEFGILEKLSFSIVRSDQCQQAFTTKFSGEVILDQSIVCANGESNVTSCHEGAPLVCPTGPPRQNRYHQTGIGTRGIECKEEVPALFANVSFARRWIDLQMEAMEFGTATYTAE